MLRHPTGGRIMADRIKGKIEDAGHKIADAAKKVGHKIAEGAEKATDWAKEKLNPEHKAGGGMCGPAKSTSEIRPHMAVYSSCGCKVGVVDHLEVGSIKLTKNDSPDGQHHYVPVDW